MTDDPFDRPITVTLTKGQIFALRDLIAESLDAKWNVSIAAKHHSDRLRGADETLETVIRNDSHDR